jgi:hypothetical protein
LATRRTLPARKAWIEAASITTGPVFRPIAKGERLQVARLIRSSSNPRALF